MRTCFDCKQVKPEKEFDKNRNKCKQCRRNYVKAWRHKRGENSRFVGEPKTDLIGKKSGKLTIVELLEGERLHGQFVWLAKCDCGNKTEVNTGRFLHKQKQSCGCLVFRKKTRAPNWKGIGQLSAVRYHVLKNKAKRRGLSFNVTHEFLWELFKSQKGICKLSGVKIDLGSSKDDYGTASLDRINSVRGYEPDNVQWVHKTVNFMKQALSDKELLEWCQKIVDHSSSFVSARDYE